MIGRLLRLGPRKPPYFAACEYWVYLPGEKLPPQEMLMARMVRTSPFAKGGERPITPNEALLFSDIRLHLGLVPKTRNVHHFRPDLFDEHCEPTKEILGALAEANAFVKLRFVSEEPLKDDRHLQFMPYLAEAVAYYGKAIAVFDAVSERLLTAEELRDALRKDPNAARPDFHLRTVWITTGLGGTSATRGLVKVGLPELQTPESPGEHRALICGVLQEAAEQLWASRELAEIVRVRYFEDEFLVKVQQHRAEPATARIMRVQAT